MTWTPPPAPEYATEGQDLSGGFMIITATNGQYTHRHKLHLWPFDPSTLNYAANFPGPAGSGFDTTPTATASAYMPLLALCYPTGYTLSMSRLVHLSNNVFSDVTFTAPSTVAGAGGTAAVSNPPDCQTTLSFKDTARNRARIVILHDQHWYPKPPEIYDGSGTSAYGQIVKMITTQSHVVSEKGLPLVAPATAHYALNRRLRRHYSYA